MKDKVVIITGASQGLGKELSIQLASLGAKIALVSRNEELLIEVKKVINNNGGIAEYFVCDVTKLVEVNATIDKVVSTFNRIDVLINNAGLWTSDELEAANPQHILETFLTNSIAPIYLTKKVLPVFEKQQVGHLVFINSIAGLEMSENKGFSVYSASKWAITGYSKAIASKFSGTDIKVTSIHPGPFVSNLDKNSNDDFGDDESAEMPTSDVANAVVYALTAPGKINVGTIELKQTNWNQ